MLTTLLPILAVASGVPSSQHVFLVVEENHNYEQVIGNASMPYLNSLANRYGLAINYDANSHYSIPNYMWLAAAAPVTMNDNTTAKFNMDNIVRHLMVAGKTWKAYAESLPYAGYVGYNRPAGCSGSTCVYAERHVPLTYFTDIANSSERFNIVPFTQLAQDIANHALPNYGFVTPNLQHDAHNGTLATADQWLKTNIAPLIASPEFQQDGILIITFDEGPDTDCRPLASCPALPENGGGGRVATIVIGPKVLRGFKSSGHYKHPNILRTMGEALGLTTFPGTAATSAAMADFFGAPVTTPPPSPGTVTISAPIAGAATGSPATISSAAHCSNPVQYMKVWVDGVARFTIHAASFSTALSVTPGTHSLTVQAYDGALHSASESFRTP
jgi:acid phosphatase